MRTKSLVCRCLLLAGLFPLSAQAVTLCTAAEVTEWSCSTRSTRYALCSSKDLGPHSGYLQYRAGTTRTTFRYPAAPEHPAGRFELHLLPRGVSMRFTNDGVQYAIDEPLAGPTTIDLMRDDAPLASITCRTSSDTLTLTRTLEHFRAAGVTR